MEKELEEILKDYMTARQIELAIPRVLRLFNVSGCQFEAYARFCIECDRQGLKPIKYEDYLKIG